MAETEAVDFMCLKSGSIFSSSNHNQVFSVSKGLKLAGCGNQFSPKPGNNPEARSKPDSLRCPQNQDISIETDDHTDNSIVHDSVDARNVQDLFVSFENGLTLPLRVVAKSFRLSHCLTVSSSQGRTCEIFLRIIAKHRRFGRKHLMVALSRAREAKLVQVV